MNDTITTTKNCHECGMPMTLDVFPSQYAGIYECTNCGASDSCEHESTSSQTVSKLTMRNGEADDYEDTVEVCDTCGVEVTIEADEPDYEGF